jgi:hypothetical protein
MYIDKELYQQAYAQYERWNEIEIDTCKSDLYDHESDL